MEQQNIMTTEFENPFRLPSDEQVFLMRDEQRKQAKEERERTKNLPVCIIPPTSFVLARTIERFKIPKDVLVICLGKSTYARCGIIVNVTPLEPGWEGHVTLEFSNTTPLPAKIYANEGVAQFIFLKGNESPKVTYADRNGKYMGQTGVTLPKV